VPAHDIAHDYYTHGIGMYYIFPVYAGLFLPRQDVTMYQRSSTYVMTTKNGWDVLFAGRSLSINAFLLFKRPLRQVPFVRMDLRPILPIASWRHFHTL
jgi:hypothetical protein